MSILTRLLSLAEAGLAAKATLRSVAIRCGVAAALALAALIALIGAAAFAVAALYDHLALSMSEPQAALIIAGILLALALLLAGIALVVLQRPHRRRHGLGDLARRTASVAAGERSADLGRLLDNVQVTPATLLGALALGVVVGTLGRGKPRR